VNADSIAGFSPSTVFALVQIERNALRLQNGVDKVADIATVLLFAAGQNYKITGQAANKLLRLRVAITL
jgi:hypothetical protein